MSSSNPIGAAAPVIPSFLSPASPQPVTGQAYSALLGIRLEADQLIRSLEQQTGMTTTVHTVGAYQSSLWSSFQDAYRLLQGWLGSWLTPAPPTTPPPTTPTQPAKGKTRFVVSSFNVLGSSHTDRGQRGYASGVVRIRQVAELIPAKDIDVVGFQEFQPDQAREFQRIAGGEFGTFPGPSKRHLGSHNTIAWRKDTWSLVESYTVDMPSHQGRMQPSPVVRLKNKHTGQEVYFTNFHNAPGFHINQQQHWRDKATTQQVALINKLKRSGLPVVVTGDMNEKANYHRRLTNEAGMDSANELKNGALPRALYVDWIFGSQDVTFKGYHRERQSVLRKISDHGMLVSKVVVGKQKG